MTLSGWLCCADLSATPILTVTLTRFVLSGFFAGFFGFFSGRDPLRIENGWSAMSPLTLSR